MHHLNDFAVNYYIPTSKLISNRKFNGCVNCVISFVEEIKDVKGNFEVYPNPVCNKVNVELMVMDQENGTIS